MFSAQCYVSDNWRTGCLRITHCSGGHPPGYRLFDVSVTRLSIKVARHFVMRLYNLNTSRVAMGSTQTGPSQWSFPSAQLEFARYKDDHVINENKRAFSFS